MKQVLFGRSGLRVSELCLGAITFGDSRSLGSTADESNAILKAFVDAGGTFIDTAHLYAEGASERIVGEFTKADRHSFVISTKYTPARSGGPQRAGNGRKNMMRSLDESLQRLGTDHVDLYWLHARDGSTPWEEIMRGLDDLVRSGRVLHVAVSDTPAWEVSRANMLAELRGWSPFIGLQIEYSLVERTPERELLPMARALGIGVTAWSPLAGGALTGKYLAGASSGAATRLRPEGISERTTRIAELVTTVAREVGVRPSQVALSWLRSRSAEGPFLIPIVGARTRSQLEENLGAVSLVLDAAVLDRLSAATKVDLGFPHEFLQSDGLRRLITGGDPSKLIVGPGEP
jgi:aryl-alcohol dehydrogenase-like predicted oxidoreductase